MTAPAPVRTEDFAALAERSLPAPVWDFVAGGSGEELTLAANRAALDRLALVPRVLTGGAGRTTATDLLGTPAALPVAVAPMAYQRLFHPDGEAATARAARAAGVPFVLSTLSSTPVEEITALGADTWFQLYCLRDRPATAGLVRRAERAGCSALMVTVDVSEMGRRLRDVRHGFALPPEVTAVHLAPDSTSGTHDTRPGSSAVAVHTAEAFAADLDWDALAELRAATRLPLIVKGLLDPRDAARAAAAGADAVVVSNHGGRQLDGAVTSVEMLPAVREAVPGGCRVLFDSGIRGGTDVLKALALGADGVLLGRPVLWGLAVDGENGVREVLRLVQGELRAALALSGCATPADARGLDVRGLDVRGLDIRGVDVRGLDARGARGAARADLRRAARADLRGASPSELRGAAR
ncbi:alpha-hydroxy acid oxidase [Streptomyces sp. G45]|uniref:alpha-hydroxy acid oxidase n=1 Tax=Streptomyces sp. G45 TaxID=3406627 RepID=UPI003C185E58